MIEAPKTLPLPETDYPAPPKGGQVFEGLEPSSAERLSSLLPKEVIDHRATRELSNPRGVVVNNVEY